MKAIKLLLLNCILFKVWYCRLSKATGAGCGEGIPYFFKCETMCVRKVKRFGQEEKVTVWLTYAI
jgi:hypothetical protein